MPLTHVPFEGEKVPSKAEEETAPHQATTGSRELRWPFAMAGANVLRAPPLDRAGMSDGCWNGLAR